MAWVSTNISSSTPTRPLQPRVRLVDFSRLDGLVGLPLHLIPIFVHSLPRLRPRHLVSLQMHLCRRGGFRVLDGEILRSMPAGEKPLSMDPFRSLLGSSPNALGLYGPRVATLGSDGPSVLCPLMLTNGIPNLYMCANTAGSPIDMTNRPHIMASRRWADRAGWEHETR